MSVPSYLEQHLRILKTDRFFVPFWDALTPGSRVRIQTLWETIDSQTISPNDHRYSLFLESTRRWFLRVQEREFQYSKVPVDWLRVIRDPTAKTDLYDRSIERLKGFVALTDIRGTEVYGGIKPESSLDRKLSETGSGNPVQVNALDVWDAVRFRIVTEDLDSLLEMAIKFWETFFDHMLRCRNYYFRPRVNDGDDAYRAIHCEVADDQGRIVEVQMMTQCREAVGLLDHPFLFKKTLSFVDFDHAQWLIEFSKKANIHDFLRASGPLD
jgi:hypothetical protein